MCSSRKGASTATRDAEPSRYSPADLPSGHRQHRDAAAAGTGSGTARLSAALDNVLDYTNPLEVIEVRLATEPVMARLAALRASQSEIKRLQTLAAKTRAASDAETYERADALFHRTIAEAARNTLFLAFFDTMRASQRDARLAAAGRERTLLQAPVGVRRLPRVDRRGHRGAQRPGSLRADAAPSRRRAAIHPRAGISPVGSRS